jgi:catechol 2,3-dioxygenase-like lactoylglutathione lyase family enzyme
LAGVIDHVSVEVRDLAASAAFYDAVFAPLGLGRLAERSSAIGFGKTYPEFWLNLRRGVRRADADTGHHLCLRAPSREAVTAFHDAALAGGGRSDGAPGVRQAAMTTYFGAFIRDLDGNKIEAATFPQKDGG